MKLFKMKLLFGLFEISLISSVILAAMGTTVYNDGNYIFEETFELALVGDSNVGKTSIVTRFTRNQFNKDKKPNSDSEMSLKNIYVNDKSLKVQIYDHIHEVSTGVLGYMLVYDITQRTSYANMQKWIVEYKDLIKTLPHEEVEASVRIILIGNKLDLKSSRAVPMDEAQAFADKNGLYFMETSALDGTNVELAFKHLVGQIDKAGGTRNRLSQLENE